MRMNPEVSIIVPLYNKVNEVERAIDSIFAQTTQDFELIIVDGGSTDGSLDVIKKYEKDPRYHLVYQVSKGVSSGRNEGISIAKADLVAFLDADDEWLPDFLETILSLREKFPEAGIYATAYIPVFGSHAQKLRLVEIPESPWSGFLTSYFLSTALAKTPPFAPCCVAIPKTTFQNIGFFNPTSRIGEDTEMWAKIALKLPVAYTSKTCAKYNWISDNKATDTFAPIIHHPFFTYVEKLEKSELYCHNKPEEIQLYLEYEELNIAYINLMAGKKDFLKANLDYVQSDVFQKHKRLIIILSILPYEIIKYIPKIKRLTLDKIRCLVS